MIPPAPQTTTHSLQLASQSCTPPSAYQAQLARRAQKSRKTQLYELNHFSDKYDDKCGYKVYKQSSVKIYNLIKCEFF